jgi:hypothetical protein
LRPATLFTAAPAARVSTTGFRVARTMR